MADEKVVVESGIAIVVVLGFIGFVVWIGATYGGETLAPEGAYGLVAAIGLFVAAMAAVGYWFSRRE